MNSKKKLNVWLPLLFSLTLIAGMMLGYRMRDGMPGKSFLSIDKSTSLQEVLDLVKAKYVDSIDVNDLTDTAIEAILGKLDPHSVYIPPSEVQESNDDIAGNFFGVGVEYDIIDDTINVINVIPDGPSFKAGIQTGDKFLKVNDSAVAGSKMKSEQIRKLLRGPDASSVTVTILRGKEQKKISIQRGIIPVTSIDAAYMIAPGTGFIRLNKFSQVTYREFMQQLEKLKNQGLQKLILDLRDNGGGVLDQAVEIADEFLEGDKLITYTEGNKFPRKEYRCKRPGLFEQGKLVVLCNEGTASASEILMGALQDWDRATIIGRRSFGKGLVQEQYDFSNGSALRLTVARYYTPLERCIQRSYKAGEKAYYDDIKKRYHDGEMVSPDSVKNDTTQKFRTPAGKIVYGGGGISPDIFISLDTTSGGGNLSNIYFNSDLHRFSYHYYVSQADRLKNFRTIQEFEEKFTLTDSDWQGFENSAAKDSSINISRLSATEKDSLKFLLKASIARQIWRNEGLYEILNTKDRAISKALETLK